MLQNKNKPAGSYISLVRQNAFLRAWRTGSITTTTWHRVRVTSSHASVPQKVVTFAGPSLIFFIWSLYFTSSASSLAIFLSIDSALLSTCKRQQENQAHLLAFYSGIGQQKEHPYPEYASKQDIFSPQWFYK